jgi:thioredoxin
MVEIDERIVHITGTSHLKELIEAKEYVIVDFYADWCGPCRKLTPELENFLKKVPNVVVAKVNVDQNEDLATDHNVSGIPYVLLVIKGKKVSEFTGFDLETLNAFESLILGK